MEAQEATAAGSGRWDHVVGELRALREAAGEPSYAEITRRVVEQRIADGRDEHAARIAKSTVHDAFRLGRSRINLALTRELARALGSDPGVVDAWLSPVAAPPVSPAPTPAIMEPATRAQAAALIAGCIALNLLGRVFVDFFALPIYLDMVGTAIAAIALGPWRGAGVGAATNVLGIVGSGLISLPFALVNIVGALVWGYGVRRFGMGRTLPRFFALNVLAAAACSLVAVPIIVAVYGHHLRVGHDVITDLMRGSIDPFLVAVGFSNLVTSLADKTITGFVALVVVSALPPALRARSGLIPAGAPDRTPAPA